MTERSTKATEHLSPTDEETIERLSSQASYAADQLGKTVRQLRQRTSVETLKRQGRERLHEMTVEKPKNAARIVGSKTADLSRQAGAFFKDQPVYSCRSVGDSPRCAQPVQRLQIRQGPEDPWSIRYSPLRPVSTGAARSACGELR
jgi:hypothetical protein